MTSFAAAVLLVVLLCICTTTHGFQSRIALQRNKPTPTVLNAVSSKTGQLLDEIDLVSLTAGTTTSSSSMVRIFQASADGWSANAFHKAVNFNPPLPVFAIMKTTSGVVAGCYNAIGWQSRDDYRESTKSFLFRVVKGSNGAVEKVMIPRILSTTTCSVNPLLDTQYFLFSSHFLQASKLPGSVACYDFGDRAIWMSEGLFVPLNEKYAPVKVGRTDSGSDPPSFVS